MVKNLTLFALPALIWGSTWLAIKYQLGVVDPIVSVFYRFFSAAIILLIYSRVAGKNLKFSLRDHLRMAQLGILLFGFNYWLVYLAELHLTSGLVALVFSTIIFLNIFNAAIFLKTKIRWPVLISAVVGFSGIALVFSDELIGFSLSSNNSLAFLLALLGAFLASLGNITSAHNQKRLLPVIQGNAFAMLYGSLTMFLIAMFSGTKLTFDFSFSYIVSLTYLSLFGSVIAFGSFLTLLGKIGADKAAYVALIVPVIALMLSTVFEGYVWSLTAMIGVVFILAGNVMVLRRRRTAAKKPV